jgi:hypothetical protein
MGVKGVKKAKSVKRVNEDGGKPISVTVILA